MAATIQTLNKPLHPRVLDTSGNNNHGTAYTGQALEFDGIGDYISADVLDIDVATENWTIACWINITAYAANSSYINVWGNAKDGSNRIGIQAYDQDSDSPKLGFATYNGSSYVSTASDVELDKDTWYYIVATCASNTLKLYINGTLQSGSTVANSLSNTVKCTVGGTTSGINVFNGKISNFQAWNALWSASDVTYAYLNPERLALENQSTSLTYSDLKLWYPMQDGDRGNQSFLLDGANTGLGDELITNGDFSDGTTGWTNTGLSEFSVSNGQATITGVDTGDHIYLNDVTGNADGKRYRMTLDIASFTGTSFGMNHNGANANFDGSGVNGSNARGLTTTGIHTFDFTWTTGYAADPRIFVVNGTLVINSFSLKAINDKNHGTSVFYGDELITNGDFASATGWIDASGLIGSGIADIVTAGAEVFIQQSDLMTAGRKYRLTYDIIEQNAGTISLRYGAGSVLTSTVGTGHIHDFVAQQAHFAIKRTGGGAVDVQVDNVSLKEVGFATGWTEADAQTTIPQLGFQSYNQLAWFDGTADTIDMDISANADLGLTTSFTVSCWAIASNSTIGYIWNFYQDTSNGIGVKMHKTVIQIYDDMTANDVAIYNTAITGDVWHHIVLSVDDSDMTLYVDGVSIGTGTDMTESLDQATYDLYIGSRRADANTAFAGAVTECSIFNSALTLAKVQELYNDGEALDALTHSSKANLAGYWRNEGGTTWTDLSTNSNDGTPTSVTEALILPEGQNNRDTQGFLMNSVRSSGLNNDKMNNIASYIDIGSTTLAAGTAYSMMAWLKPSDLSTNYWFGSGVNYFSINTSTTILVNHNNVGDTFTVSSMTVDEWLHLAIVRDTSNLVTVYVDGIANGGATLDTETADQPFTYRYIGSTGTNPTYTFNGQIDDVAIYDTELSAAQVLRNYKAGKGRHRN